MFVENDSDVKIAGDKPSKDIKRNMAAGDEKGVSGEQRAAAKRVGAAVAEKFLKDADDLPEGENTDYGLLMQRRLLLSFAATAGFEQYIPDDTLSGVAQKSFLDALKKAGDDIYKTSSDMGAFSFYYLAFRRGNDVERRIGQTFAMLCSHDGDPIYQELGEALYCWFNAVVRKATEEYL
ncbi:MAG: hypothetical protein IK086_00180 [Clostridia bacterium]|nr:hypothetical protein [Clostridia bacterium]